MSRARPRREYPRISIVPVALTVLLLLALGTATAESLLRGSPAPEDVLRAGPAPVEPSGASPHGLATLTLNATPSGSNFVRISAGLNPIGVVYDNATGDVFVSDYGSNSLTVVSASTDSVIATIPVGSGPLGSAYDYRSGAVYVTNEESENLSVVNATSYAPIASVNLGNLYSGIDVLYDPGQNEVFVASGEKSAAPYYDLLVVDPENNTVTARINPAPAGFLGSAACSLAYDARLGEVFVGLCGTNIVSVINDSTDEVVGNITVVGDYIESLAFDPVLNQLLACVGNPGTFVVVDANADIQVADVALSQEIGVRSAPQGIAIDTSLNEFLVADSYGNVSVINASSDLLEANIPVPYAPQALAYAGGQSQIFLAGSGNGTIPGPGGGLGVLNASQPLPYNISLSQSAASVIEGETISFHTADDGFVGRLSYQYASPSSADCAASNLSTLTCRPSQSGEFAVSVMVTGLTGRPLVASSAVVEVVAQPTKTVKPPWQLWLLGSILGIGIVVLILAFVVGRRGRIMLEAPKPSLRTQNGSTPAAPPYAAGVKPLKEGERDPGSDLY
jgi:YVTN family beta-propeller protein